MVELIAKWKVACRKDSRPNSAYRPRSRDSRGDGPPAQENPHYPSAPSEAFQAPMQEASNDSGLVSMGELVRGFTQQGRPEECSLGV